ncbi:hypothetical protein VCHA34P126_50076 [Vibrio chagasii]|nr:hypothetical protein VCHA34P126_50076 [Vibrio chagasii]CAH7474106.1 hypothetical protein VCHA50P420_60212 [Vibrio chagasii]
MQGCIYDLSFIYKHLIDVILTGFYIESDSLMSLEDLLFIFQNHLPFFVPCIPETFYTWVITV